jgi:hypothetical protein
MDSQSHFGNALLFGIVLFRISSQFLSDRSSSTATSNIRFDMEEGKVHEERSQRTNKGVPAKRLASLTPPAQHLTEEMIAAKKATERAERMVSPLHSSDVLYCMHTGLRLGLNGVVHVVRVRVHLCIVRCVSACVVA